MSWSNAKPGGDRVTDLATRPATDDDSSEHPTVDLDQTATTELVPAGGVDEPAYEWAPAEPAAKKRRVGLWIGAGAGAALAGLVASSLMLIAPGTSIAGVHVGWLTPGAATDAVTQQLAATTVVLTGDGGGAEVTGADLGASVDAQALAAAAYEEHPMWNLGAWFPEPSPAIVHLDDAAAASVLRAAAPALYTDPVNATLAYDAASATYVTTPSVDGAGVDLESVRAALSEALAAGESSIELDATLAPVRPETPTYVAAAAAAKLNAMLDTAGFYVGAERTVPVAREVMASWLTITPAERGTFAIAVDEAAIEAVVPTLAAQVDRAPVNATVITDTSGNVLREETTGVVGRVLGDTSTIASDYAAQLTTGSAAFALPVTETEFTTTALARNIVVDLGSQRTYLYQNGQLVNSYASSSGLPGTPTFTGSYRVFAKVSMQDMGCFPGAPYCTENVPWVTYFNGDQGFHGTYWHSNFGSPMSHGCVNLPTSVAKFVYDWAPIGTEVRVTA